MDAAFGPKGKTMINSGSARGKVKATPVGFVTGGLRILRGMLGARLRGQGPMLFFDGEGQPIRGIEVLSATERAALQANNALS
jgi:hypothetical protein